MTKIRIENPEDLDDLQVAVTPGYVGPDSDFSGGSYWEFCIRVEYGKTVAWRWGSADHISLGENLTKNMDGRLKGELDSQKEDYLKEIEKGPIEIDLDELTKEFLGDYRDTNKQKTRQKS